MHAALPFALALLAALSGPAGAQTGQETSATQAVCRHLLAQLRGLAAVSAEARSQAAQPVGPAARLPLPAPPPVDRPCAADRPARGPQIVGSRQRPPRAP